MTVLSLGIRVVAIVALVSGARAQDRSAAPPLTEPETIDVQATLSARGAAAGAVTAPLVIQIDRYTPEHALTTMTDALKYRGYPGFLQALREAPRAGWLEVAGERFVIRWARQQPDENGRTLSFVTDAPVFFVGSGRRGAKSTAGYEVAVVQIKMDPSGRGVGTMAAAARVKPHNTTGVQIDNYADAPMTLTAVARRPR